MVDTDRSMEENSQTGLIEGNEPKTPKFRGLYRYVNISVRTLDIIIGCCIAVIVIVVAVNLLNPGYTVHFDPRGGTDVKATRQQYGEKLKVPDAPTREGYVFTGWYLDPSCDESWDLENRVIEGEITLYAGWQQK